MPIPSKEKAALMSITASQCRAGRALLNWSQEALGEAAAVGNGVVAAFEDERERPQADALQALAEALQRGGVSFIDDNQTSGAGGPGVRLLRSPGEIDTDQSQTVQYKEHLAPDAPTGAGG